MHLRVLNTACLTVSAPICSHWLERIEEIHVHDPPYFSTEEVGLKDTMVIATHLMVTHWLVQHLVCATCGWPKDFIGITAAGGNRLLPRPAADGW